jgi:hypothetical protein
MPPWGRCAAGKLLYVIHDAHKTQGMKRVSGNLFGVTALAVSHDNGRLISGGADSQVCLGPQWANALREERAPRQRPAGCVRCVCGGWGGSPRAWRPA